ncbi:filament integrity protein FraC [Calothrix sp. 336/3]|uniref:filament integrity protein FraC n=1 Tax=Calothrix sp. 336/3 TaxID=1337936 RepID=UPI0004E400C1|nr:filament integrity protein FraC [Calothrix sp. 336/3]AKG23376.1 filament integrity protein fraC [Calothrix sp. 336/3]
MFRLPPLPTFPTVFPLGVILFDFLFLLIAIAIEAYVLNNRLKFDKKTSTFYALAMNLFSSAIGWFAFFLAEPLLPIQLKSELISYIFFNRFQSNAVQGILILTAFIIFFSTFLVKFIFLKVLLISLSEFEKKPELDVQSVSSRRFSRRFRARIQNTNLATTTLIANSLSYSAIVLVILLRAVNL